TSGSLPRSNADSSPNRTVLRDGSGFASPAAEMLERTWQDQRTLVGFLRVNDHKRLGRRFVVTAFGFFVVAGLLAVLMRVQLAFPDQALIGPDLYNQVFTIDRKSVV